MQSHMEIIFQVHFFQASSLQVASSSSNFLKCNDISFT